MKDSIVENINKIITGTQAGKIFWTKASESTFIWYSKNSEGKSLNVVVQGYKTGGSLKKILFRLWDVEAQDALIDIYTDKASEEIKGKIFELYDVVVESLALGRTDILSDLLRDL